MRAELVIDQKEEFPDGTIVQLVVWSLPASVPGSAHRLKYRLFFGRPGERIVGYDNERGKGDHRHYGDTEEDYRFVGIRELLRDFWSDVDRWRSTAGDDDRT